jgi:hypothetical protein
MRDGLLLVAFFANLAWTSSFACSPRHAPADLDWIAFRVAAEHVMHGEGSLAYADSFRTGWKLPQLYPPPMLTLIAPLGLGPPWVAYRALQLASVAFLAIALFALREPLGDRRGLLAAALLASAPWILNVQLGQLGALWLLVFATIVAMFRAERRVAAGLALAVLTLKPTLAMFALLAILVRKERRALAGFACGLLALAAASLPLGAGRAWRAYLDASTRMVRLVDRGVVDNWRQQTLRAALRGSLPHAIADSAYAIAFIVAVVLFVRRLRRGARRDDAFDWIALVALTTVVFSPYVYLYDAIVLFLPAAHAVVRAEGYTVAARRLARGSLVALFTWQILSLLGIGRGLVLAGFFGSSWWLAMALGTAASSSRAGPADR